MNAKIIEAAKALGEMIKEDAATVRYEKASANYQNDNSLNAIITEYNVQRTALAEEYKKEERDQALIDSINKRIAEVYKDVTTHPVYTEYVEAQEEMNALVNAVNREITAGIYGEYPEEECTHDCSTCGGSCGHHH
ncbi:MAG: YlbF family regulator [Clostridia bacterium]|nr:YlbF family regulator [Clostridia bacterium]